jgi:nucleolar protein 56
MQAYIVTTFIGVVAVDEGNKVIALERFGSDPHAVAQKMKESDLSVIPEEKSVMHRLAPKKYFFMFPFRKEGAKKFEQNNPGEKFVKENLRKIASDAGIFKDQAEFNQLLTKVNLEIAKIQIKKSFDRSNLVVQVNGAIEELDKSINIFSERLREWYSINFPEMDRLVSSHEKFAKLVEKFGERKNVEDPELSLIKNKSMGADMEQVDMEPVKKLASALIALFEERKYMESYLSKLLKEVAPNFASVAGDSLAAKLIAKAGGLDRLARMPSSTVQLLGAEKALFRYLKGRGGSPRHGIIFSHTLIQNAPDGHRGKIARMLAAKLSIAAKLDYYSKGAELRGEKMKKDLEEKVAEVLKEPAPDRPKRPQQTRDFGGNRKGGRFRCRK